MQRRQFAVPVLVENGYDEKWLQELLYRQPRLLPVGELEPMFDHLRPVCRELPTESGSVDLMRQIRRAENRADSDDPLLTSPHDS